MFVTFEVGKPFPITTGYPKQEGASLNFTAEGSLFMMIHWRNITADEKREMKKGVIQFRYIQEGGFIIPLMRLGTMPPIEFPFDPTLYERHGVPFQIQSNQLTIYAVDYSNHHLVAMREIGLSQSFLEHFNQVWKKNLQDENFRSKYQAWFEKLFQKMSTNDLWKQGIPIEWKI